MKRDQWRRCAGRGEGIDGYGRGIWKTDFILSSPLLIFREDAIPPRFTEPL
jgi:hypothetical protein